MKPSAEDLKRFLEDWQSKADKRGVRFKRKEVERLQKAYRQHRCKTMNDLFTMVYGTQASYNYETRKVDIRNPIGDAIFESNVLLKNIKPDLNQDASGFVAPLTEAFFLDPEWASEVERDDDET